MAELLKLGDFIAVEQLKVNCPYCFAPAGEPCQGQSGAVSPHKQRSEQALKRLYEKKGPKKETRFLSL